MERTAPLIIDESAFRTLLERAPGFITVIDADMRVRYNNRLVAGFDPGELIGMHVEELMTPEQKPLLMSAYERARCTGEEQTVVFYIEIPNDRRWLSAHIAALRDASGAFLGYVNVTTDVTSQKVAEQAFRKIQAELLEASHRAGMAEVATGVLHSVGNVLNSVNVAAETLREGLSSTSVAMLARTIKLCRDQGDRLVEFLVSDPRGKKVPELLDRLVDQLTAEQQGLLAEAQRLVDHIAIIRSTVDAQQSIARTGTVIEEVWPEELIERVLSIFRIDLQNKRIRVELEAEDCPPVLMDKQGAQQILANLIRNAIEAMTEVTGARTLHIKLYSSADQVSFEVADNGCGISAEDMTRIFRHGFTTKASGHGFGLHSSAITARTMGGSLDAESDGPGRGARFRLQVPRHVALSTDG
jgi:two-component system, NtrC family, sensor kinase